MRPNPNPTEYEARCYELFVVKKLMYREIRAAMGLPATAVKGIGGAIRNGVLRYCEKMGIEPPPPRYQGRKPLPPIGHDDSDDTPKCRCGLRLSTRAEVATGSCSGCLPRSAKELAEKGIGQWTWCQ